MNVLKNKIPPVIRNTFSYATVNFILIISYVTIFQTVFGPENSIVGVIFAIMMSASMVRDMTGTPLKHLLIQAFVMVGMTVSAFFVTVLPPVFSFLVNLITLFLILYSFTYEYSSHMYFPYILSYLFLIFITPVGFDGLPKRIAGMLVGAVSIIIYQWFAGRRRVVETARDVLSAMIDYVCGAIDAALSGSGTTADPAVIRSKLCELSRTVYERRKKVLCVSEASFSMIDVGRGLEQLIILIHELGDAPSEEEKELLLRLLSQMKLYRSFLHRECSELPPLKKDDFQWDGSDSTKEAFFKTLLYVHDRMLHMTDPEKRTHYRKTVLSIKTRLLAALDLSPVRVVYAARISLLLAAATLLVQVLELPHGRWLLFTLGSLSMPYADDIPLKTKKRIKATLIGGIFSVAYYTLIPSAPGRSAAMMFSGYLSFYLSDYVGTFACSTIGALGGAVSSVYSLSAIGNIFLIRVAYILAGAAIAYIANCLLFPFKRAKATEQLLKKYQAVVALLTKLCRTEDVDPQLYYNLVIQAHLQEDKLSRNASAGGWDEIHDILGTCRDKVREAHRIHITEWDGAPVFEPRHLSKGL